MKKGWLWPLAALLLGVGSLTVARAEEELPPEAGKLLQTYEEEVAAIQKKAEAAVQERRERTIAGLRELQESYTRDGKTEAAAAVRARIRALESNSEATVGQKAEVEWNGTWWKAQVLKVKDGQYYIHYDGYDDSWNEWVGKDRIRFAEAKNTPTEGVEILWKGTWYKGRVLEEKDGKYRVHYDGYDDSWDEWVDRDHIRRAADSKVHRRAEVLWGGKWWKAEVLKVKDGEFYIHYDGYDDSWNEWVGKDRIRFSEDQNAAVEILWNGTWYKGRVMEEKDGKYYVHYDGYSDSWNEWVDKDHIRTPSNKMP